MMPIRRLLLVMTTVQFVIGQDFETVNGRVRGKRISVMGKSLDVFHGIPFAKPPIGDLRFKHPQPADPWRPEVKDATVETASCIQPTTRLDQLPPGNPRRLTKGTSEDCLYLSIWKPTSANPGSNKAVMVFIYGGSFTNGATNQPIHNGQYLAAESDVIVVSINYRVGPLGFAFLSPDTIPGNAGMMDQVEGMKWVKRNVENFGGDKNRITLFGESAGSFSVGFHLVSPLSRNLFHNAILQSGVPVRKVLDLPLTTKSKARASVMKLSETLQCPTSSDADVYACLKAADSSTINNVFEQLLLARITFNPTVDGYFLPTDPSTLIESGQHNNVNIMTGVTKDEITVGMTFYINPANMIIYTTGEKYSGRHFTSALKFLSNRNDENIFKAMKIFYDSEVSLSHDHVQILNHAGSDILFKCPTLLFSSLYANTNDVYLYSLHYRLSNTPLPEWMGVAHSYDLDLMFGLPLNDSLGFNDQDKELSRNMMKYWSNFAKSRNPNSPEEVTTHWTPFNNKNQTYLILDVGSNVATQHGFRRHQCTFVNDILPMIPGDLDTTDNPPTWPDILCPSTGTGSGLSSDCFHVVLGLVTVSVWMLIK